MSARGPTPLTVEFLKPDGVSVRHKLIKEIITHWVQNAPGMAREISRFLKEQTSQQIHSSGKWRTTGDGYYKISLPAPLFYTMRMIFKRVLPDEPVFAHTDDDIVFMMKEFPDLIGGKNMDTVRKKKDYRKKTKLWSSSIQ